MTSSEQPQIRASDAEREQVAARIQQAGAEGRLTLDEVEERLGRIYAARFRRELGPLTADLPAPKAAPPARRSRWNGPLGVHALVAAVLSAMMIAHWAASDSRFFWPLFPMFWIWASVALHARWRRGPWAGGARRWPGDRSGPWHAGSDRDG